MLIRKPIFPNVIELNFQAGQVYGCNVYLIYNQSEWVLIDIGFEENVDELVELIRKHRGNASVYYRLDQTLEHAQTKALGVLQEVESDGKMRTVRRFPARFSSLRPQLHARAPRLGEHTREVALELGLEAEESR